MLDLPELRGSTIISCGLGEDASFDVEFANAYEATVIIVDPTPRAVQHFKELTARIGKPAATAYNSRGRQPPEAYDLRGLSACQLQLVPKALWVEETTIKFFAPSNPGHVSHSIVDYQNNYSKAGASIDVETVTLAGLIAALGVTSLPLLKLDIEGAEVPVLEDMLVSQIRPTQILVEFDELNMPSPPAKMKFEKANAALRRAGYSLKSWDHRSNFLYAASA